jgi:serine/threonine-protein phosphatase 2A catalytic subunit
MSLDTTKLDEHIEKLRSGNTLTENEVRALCDQVSRSLVVLVVGSVW